MIEPIKGPSLPKPIRCNLDKMIGDNKVVAYNSTDVLQLSNGKSIVIHTSLKGKEEPTKIVDVVI